MSIPKCWILCTCIALLRLWGRRIDASGTRRLPSLPRNYNGTGFNRISPFDQRNRKLVESSGMNIVLMVRVSADEGFETTSSLESIVETVFGGSPTVASQYNECSDGALTLLNGGAVEIMLPYSVFERETDTDEDFLDDMRRLAEEEAGVPVPGDFDHVLFCLPEGTTVAGNPNWVGLGDFGGYGSWYNDGKCEQILTIMHEIGHNFGLGHSTQLSDPSLLQGEYEDRTCTMGIDDRQTRKCFNAPKSEQLGWYDESYITNFDAPPEANILDKCLFGVGEYSLQPDASEYQLWYRIGDIYITFNRDAGPNAQTQECRDKVLIHRAPTFSPEGVELSSDLLMCLKSGETYIGEGYMVNVKDIDTRIEPGCARISVLVGETAAPTALDGTLEPTMTPEPSPAPTTEVFSIDFSITNFFNDNPVTITIIGSCNNVVLERTLPAGMAGNGRFTANVEDLYRVFITDAGGNGGATYTISYRGVQQVSNDNFSTAETCHLVGAESPICDDIECPATESPSQSPSKMPVPAPTPAPVPPPTPAPTEAPVPVTGPETSESPTTSFEPSASPTASPAPSNSPMPSTRPGRCLIEVMIDKCGELVADQSPVEDCDCYNYCNGLFLGCCPYDMFCPVSCPSSDFVAGCELDMTMAPSSSPSMSPVTQPTGRPTQVLPPSIDDPPMQLPTFPPLPPSEDGFRPLPPSGDPFPVGQTARGEPYGYNTYYNNYGASPYVEEVEIPASPVESFWATSVLTRGRYGNRKAVSRRLEEIGDKKFERFRSKIQGKRKGPMS